MTKKFSEKERLSAARYLREVYNRGNCRLAHYAAEALENEIGAYHDLLQTTLDAYLGRVHYEDLAEVIDSYLRQIGVLRSPTEQGKPALTHVSQLVGARITTIEATDTEVLLTLDSSHKLSIYPDRHAYLVYELVNGCEATRLLP